MKIDNIKNAFRCPKCNNSLVQNQTFFFCEKCFSKYVNQNEKIIFYHSQEEVGKSNSDSLISKIKYYLKQYPTLYYVLAFLLGGALVNKTAKKFAKNLDKDLKIINIGSGTKVLREDVVNIDFQELPGVDIVADAYHLPFKDDSINVVICDYLLEHLENPSAVIVEINRVLKIGGIIYLGVPFIIGFHSAPYDFYRWTKQGLRELIKNFEQKELKASSGPTSAFVWVTAEWLATLLSFNIFILYQVWLIFFTIILAPLKLFDFLISNFKSSENVALGFYFIGKKK